MLFVIERSATPFPCLSLHLRVISVVHKPTTHGQQPTAPVRGIWVKTSYLSPALDLFPSSSDDLIHIIHLLFSLPSKTTLHGPSTTQTPPIRRPHPSRRPQGTRPPLLPAPQQGLRFPLRERHALGLVGRLPYRPNTIDEQCARVYAQLQDRETPLRKNTFLQSVKDQNWTLYYALLARHLKELVPIIYTPTEVCQILLSLNKILISFLPGRGDRKLLPPLPPRGGIVSVLPQL